MSEEKTEFSKESLYKYALDLKKHQEQNRAQINNRYVSLLSAMGTAVPFIDKITTAASGENENHLVRIVLTFFALIGVILSISWGANIKRLYHYIRCLDEYLMDIETKANVSLLNYVAKDLDSKNIPDNITKYQLALPYSFGTIFFIAMLYSLLWVIIK